MLKPARSLRTLTDDSTKQTTATLEKVEVDFEVQNRAAQGNQFGSATYSSAALQPFSKKELL